MIAFCYTETCGVRETFNAARRACLAGAAVVVLALLACSAF